MQTTVLAIEMHLSGSSTTVFVPLALRNTDGQGEGHDSTDEGTGEEGMMSSSTVMTTGVPYRDRPKAAVSCDEEMDLISQAQGGSRAAFDHLMNRYQNRILRLAKRITGNAEDGEDVLQNAFMKAYINLPRFRGDSRFYTWLTAITLNEARMALRRRKGVAVPIGESPDASLQTASWEPMDCRPDPESESVRRQLCEVVDRHLIRMPLSLQALIHLRYDEELSVARSALLLGISETAAKSQLHRGMVQLRSSLRQQLCSENQDIGAKPQQRRRAAGAPVYARATAGKDHKGEARWI